MDKEYLKFTEAELLERFPLASNIVEAVNIALRHGYSLISVSYVGGCRASGYHVYHFIY